MSLNWADVVVLTIIGISAYLEYRRGFLLSVFKTLSFFIAIFLCWILQPFVTGVLQKTFLYDLIHGSVTQSLFKENLVGQMIPKDKQVSIIDSLQVPDFIKGMLKNSEGLKDSKLINFDDMKVYIIDFVTNIFTSILSIILVFIIVMIILKVASGLLGIISSIPILKEINQLFGIGLGIIIGLIEVWISYMIIIFLFGTNAGFNFVFSEINKSVLAKILYENNLLSYFLLGIFK